MIAAQYTRIWIRVSGTQLPQITFLSYLYSRIAFSVCSVFLCIYFYLTGYVSTVIAFLILQKQKYDSARKEQFLLFSKTFKVSLTLKNEILV